MPPDAAAADDDTRIFAQLRAGDRAELDRLYRATYADLWQFAFTYVRAAELADEVVQDVFVALLSSHDTLPRAGTIRGYLFAAVRNRALNAVRSARRTLAARDQLTRDDGVTMRGTTPSSADVALATDDLRHAVARAVHALPERQQRAVLLRYAARLSLSEVAHALGISADAARMLVNRATLELRRQLAPLLEDGSLE